MNQQGWFKKISVSFWVRFSLFPVLVLSLYGVGCSENPPTAPDFTLHDLSQKKVRLADFRGKVVILNFFATWCPPCRAEIPELIKIYKGHQDKGLVVLGVSLDTDGLPQILTKFIRDMKIPYPVLVGSLDLMDRYQINGVPTTMIISKEGKVLKRYDGLVPGSQFMRDIGKLL